MVRAAAILMVTILAHHNFWSPGQEADVTGLKVAHFARSLQPGEVVVIRVESREELKRVEGRAFGSTFPFYSAGGEWHGLVGIDLEVRPGPYRITIEGTDAGGTGVSVEHPLTVGEKEFPTRHLTVDERFVNPPAEVVARIERERKRVDKILAGVTAQKSWSGSFLSPVPGAATSRFGERSIFNGRPRSPHSGADFRAPAGTPVIAPNSGRIVLAANLYLSGKTVIIDHGLGLYSYFAHLSRFAVKEGAKVRRGALIGNVGATGRVTGPHLHWSVRLIGARVDPLSLMAAVSAEPGERKQVAR